MFSFVKLLTIKVSAKRKNEMKGRRERQEMWHILLSQNVSILGRIIFHPSQIKQGKWKYHFSKKIFFSQAVPVLGISRFRSLSGPVLDRCTTYTSLLILKGLNVDHKKIQQMKKHSSYVFFAPTPAEKNNATLRKLAMIKKKLQISIIL